MAETDKTNFQAILKLLPDEDVFELMKTVTGKVDKSSRSSAEEAILKATSSREEFFKRGKITKALLTGYIYKQGWQPPKRGEKRDLIDFITQKWDTADIRKKNPSNESNTGTMSSEEKELCRAILKSFPHEKDLLELVTAMKIKGFDKNCHRGDAEDAVLNATKSFAEFFKHQKLNKMFLLKFINSQGWDTIRADKQSLIDYIRQKWKVTESGKKPHQIVIMAETDKTNVQAILKLLPDEDVFELMKTVTGKVDKSSRSSAEEAILKATNSREEFFKRGKITKALLTGYIYKQDWELPKGEKKELIDYITQKWDTADISKKNPSKPHQIVIMAETDKTNVQAILKLLPDEDVFELMKTVTGKVDKSSRSSAEEAILKATNSREEFFKRGKITKALLTGYIYKQDWELPKGEKKELIDYITQKWDTADISKKNPSLPIGKMSKTDKQNCLSVLKVLPENDVFDMLKRFKDCVDNFSRKDAEDTIVSSTKTVEDFFKLKGLSNDLLVVYINSKGWTIPKGGKQDKVNFITDQWKAHVANATMAPPAVNESSTGTMSLEEKELCRAILKSFAHEKDLLELVTALKIKGFDKNCHRGDAEDAVLNATKSFEEFFKHHKLNKEFLLKFIFSQGWHSIRGNKQIMIEYILQQWKVTEAAGKGGPFHGRKGGVKRSSDSETPSSSKKLFMSKSGKSSDAENSHKTDDSMRRSYHFPSTLGSGDLTAATKLGEKKKPAVPSQSPDSSEFFNHYLKCFGPNLFHHDSKLILTWKKSEGSTSETIRVYGKDSVANRISALSQADEIKFSWSLDDSKVETFSSEKKAIYFCGNLEKEGNRFGIFYQGCLLLKVYLSVSGQDEWLIKYTMLTIREGIQVSPSLNDNDAAALEEDIILY